MSDLIYRQAAIRLAEQGQIQGFEWQFKKLCTLPSADLERKKGKGKWNRLAYDTFNCPNCGHTFIVVQGESFMNFCPNCNADMRGE